jgi:hypothetical protein
MPAFIKIADLHHRRIRKREPVLVGRIGRCRLVLVDRHDPRPGDPAATLFAMVEQTPQAQHDYSESWLPPPPCGPGGHIDVRVWVTEIIEAAAARAKERTAG